MVVLYRTNAQSRAPEEQLLSNKVPYVVIGGTNFYDRKEVKDLLSYLRIAAGRASFEDVRRTLNAPMRFLGKEFLGKVENIGGGGARRNGANRPGMAKAREGGVDWTEVVRRAAALDGLQQRQRTSARAWADLIESMAVRISEGRAAMERDGGVPSSEVPKPAQLIEEVITVTDYTAWLTRDEGTESPENNRVSNVRELVRASERFNCVDALLDYVEETLEASRRAKREADDQPNRVTLMSIHRSKGLEWPVVFLIGANEKILPHGRCEDPNEERRLAYVAFTRARDTLKVSCVQQAALGTRVVMLEPSRFLEEAGLEPVLFSPDPMLGDSEEQSLMAGVQG
jgi:DNA helicase-2/ATP-dependent DNA helicase PcrA